MFVRGDEDNAVFKYVYRTLVTQYYPATGEDEYFMFPGVGVGWGRTPGLHFKYPHAEIWRSVFTGNDLSLDYSF